ncbi:unnamed protein product [Calicophoron daubneyi]|uniref:Calcineurin-like phosphoesterase domain-containing protein n=1 Tax=Calicophoron daubneyi TaxID=300641 RepID=A0AAV2TYH2_CALDB
MENHRVNGSSSYKFKSDSSIKLTSTITSRAVRVLGLIITVLILGEYVLPILYYYNWDVPARRQNYDEMRILLLSDPHVEGYSPALHHLNYILQYDSDRYLRDNFRRAVSEVDPELVVILDDLLDRGSIATDKEFVDSCARFREIFLTSHNVPVFEMRSKVTSTTQFLVFSYSGGQ